MPAYQRKLPNPAIRMMLGVLLVWQISIGGESLQAQNAVQLSQPMLSGGPPASAETPWNPSSGSGGILQGGGAHPQFGGTTGLNAPGQQDNAPSALPLSPTSPTIGNPAFPVDAPENPAAAGSAPANPNLVPRGFPSQPTRGREPTLNNPQSSSDAMAPGSAMPRAPSAPGWTPGSTQSMPVSPGSRPPSGYPAPGQAGSDWNPRQPLLQPGFRPPNQQPPSFPRTAPQTGQPPIPGWQPPTIPAPYPPGFEGEASQNPGGVYSAPGSASNPDSTEPGTEIVRERYPDGKIRVERQVVLDDDSNYVNHGYWKHFLPDGQIAAEARFQRGIKTGVWFRWISEKETNLFRQPPYNQFRAPFLSRFQYDNDVLQGEWTLTDSANRTVFKINLVDGQRDSACVWYFNNGQKFQEIHYRQGLLHGPYLKWNTQGQLVENRKFVAGQEVGKMTDFHRPGIKKIEIGILAGKVEALSQDNPWTLEFADEKKIGQDIKHGSVTAWYPNGQVQFTGSYEQDIQTGKFTWYYSTGQKQAEGQFADDQRSGEWIWWHENGMRASVGYYTDGVPSGDWQWWLADGKLSRSRSFGETVESNDRMKNASFRER